jgi:Flp pilus assembly secretin CpaC/tetratricopeptide (TPR) repeat protein
VFVNSVVARANGLKFYQVKLLVCCIFLGSCVLGDRTQPNQKNNSNLLWGTGNADVSLEPKKPTGSPKQSQLNSEIIDLEQQAVSKLKNLEFDEASKLLNQALKRNIQSPKLQFLNGFTYHQMAGLGDKNLLNLAEQGYKLAIQFDPTNWIPFYHYGILNLDKKDYQSAQRNFAQAAILNRKNSGILYNLAIASYNSLDPVTAAGALAKLRNVSTNGSDPKVLRLSSMVMAALNDHGKAIDFLNKYKKISGENVQSVYLAERLRQWQSFYQTQKWKKFAGVQLVQAPTEIDEEEQSPDGSGSGQLNSEQEDTEESEDTSNEEGEEEDNGDEANNEEDEDGDGEGEGKQGSCDEENENGEEASDEEESDQPIKLTIKCNKRDMVIVDVVIIRTEETKSSRKGVNLLNGLNLQFGGESPGTGAYSYRRSRSTQFFSDSDNTSVLTRTINLPSITYSLNIVNANNARNEILARPSLVALDGNESEFFSGTNVIGTVIGTGGGDGAVNVAKDIGVKLKVTPYLLKDGRVKLKTFAERTFLAKPNTSAVTFSIRIDTAKTSVRSSVALKLGDTLILSGLSEKQTIRKRDGVPGIQDIPLIQYFFSKKEETLFQKSVLILLTPRKPGFVQQEAETSNKKSNASGSNALDELKSRYSDWFKPYPNWASVFQDMQNNSLYREFRTGDVSLEKWVDHDDRELRIRRALKFLYY